MMNDRSVIDLLYRAKENGIDLSIKEGQLQLKLPKNKGLDNSLLETIKTNKDIIREFLKKNERVVKPHNKINKVDRGAVSHIPLSFSQERLWFIDQLEGSIAYHIPSVLRLRGKLNKEALSYALKSVVDRHEVLRTVVLEDEGRGYQHIQDKDGWQLNTTDGSVYIEDEIGLAGIIERLIKAPFDLSKDYMLRANLLYLSNDEHLLISTMHHIASDGWSTSVLVKELVELYASFVDQRPARLQGLPVQYADYALWQRNYLQGELLEGKIRYWQEKLHGVAPLELPLEFARPAIHSSRGSLISFTIEKKLADALHALSQNQGVTLFMTLLAAFKVLLYRYSGQQDICVGTGIAGRQHKELEGLIGFFVNTLAIRTQVKGDTLFTELLQQVRENTMEAFEHQDLPFEKLVGAVAEERDMSRSPLFQVLFMLQNTPDVPQLHLQDIELSPEPFASNISKFDLTLSITETASGLKGAMQFSTDLFSGLTIERMIAHLKEVFTSIVKQPKQRLATLSLLTDSERRQLSAGFNNSSVEYPEHKTIVDLFEEQVTKAPETLAVRFEDEQLSYRELNERANQLARYLRSKGVKQETLVPICIRRSTEMLVGILGILKAGGAYVPIDPDYPEERIRFIIADTTSNIVISSKDSKLNLEKIKDLEILELDNNALLLHELPFEDLPVSIDPASLVYVIYTSGSTGKPKGVMIEHRALLDHCFGLIQNADLNTCASFALFAPLIFDAGHSIIHSAFILGGSLNVISDSLLMDGERLASYLDKYPVDCLKIVPSLWMSYAEEHNLVLAKKVMIFGGEPFSLSVLKRLTKANFTGNVFNHYGPTEATIGKCLHKVDLKKSYSIIPIGKPFSNTSVYVVDEALQIVPVGVQGELYIGGVGLAREYLNRPELTSEKFLKDPFSGKEGARVYKTGDLVRWLPDGNIEYLGRKDEQVKIRGHRIELGEIESVLLKSELVNEAVVLVKEDKQGTKRLVGYAVADGELNKEEITSFLQGRLPDYMIPALWVQMESFPITVNGKIDKKQLPEPEFNKHSSNRLVGARNETEADFIQIWKDLLGADEIGVEDNFFELGGDSILTIQVVSRAKRLGYFLQPKDLFIHQTIEGLARATAARSATAASGEQGVLRGNSGLLPIQQWFFEKNTANTSRFSQSVLLRIDKTVTKEVLIAATRHLTLHHDALRFTYYEKEGQWHQEYGSATGNVLIEDLSSVDESSAGGLISNLVKKHQQGLDIKSGELTRVVLVKTGSYDTANRLFIVIHHLAVDGVSWRIIIEDLEQLIGKLMVGEKVDLGLKSSSYRQWYEALRKYGESKRFLSGSNYWINVFKNYRPLRTDKVALANTKVKDVNIYKIALSEEETLQLIQEVPRVYHTEINDILIAALAKALCEWGNTDSITIGLEGHGRHEISENIDIVRTVGWFTTHYPVLLQCDNSIGDNDWIVSVKEQLRQVVDKGLGYGVQKYVNRNPELQQADPWDIIFNYFGQLDNVVRGSKWFEEAKETPGTGTDEEYVVNEKISVNASIRSGSLSFNWSYSTLLYHDETIRKLAESNLTNLKTLIAHCVEQQKTGKKVHTPSDYGLGSEISYKELESFLEEEDEKEDNILSF